MAVNFRGEVKRVVCTSGQKLDEFFLVPLSKYTTRTEGHVSPAMQS